jgi:hypothetical protein
VAENSTRGRPAGSRNRLTRETLALIGEGETPVAYMLGIMRDIEKPQDIRLQAARFAAPYLHPRPQPEPRLVSFALPENLGSAETLSQIHLSVLKSVADGELSLDEGKEISVLLENQRRIIETTDIMSRLAKLEAAQSR